MTRIYTDRIDVKVLADRDCTESLSQPFFIRVFP